MNVIINKKFATALGWIATALILASPHLLRFDWGLIVFVVSGFVALPQVLLAKQWNLVIINVNIIVAYSILYLNQ